MPKREIKCEICGEMYIPKDNFNSAFAFAWCSKCCVEEDKKYNDKLKKAIREHLRSDFKNEYEATKWAWQLLN